ncbi:MAG: DUF302 domain-containing protein [Deltaproteobacteria bacterium]|nr:MAG: DUF302 domain-containing protein [Deltaproteobacteria bacterium]
MAADVFCTTTDKSIVDFINDLARSMTLHNFIIHNEEKMEMVRHFGHQGVALAEDFDLHMVQVCSPKKAARSLSENLERAVLLPQFIVVFTQDQKTQVRMLRYGRELVAELVDDADFPEQNAVLCDSLISAINEAL